MVILGVPYDLQNYYMADDDVGFVLQQEGFCPKYKDNDALYFKKNTKLIKALEKLGIEF